jgi:hypothetical protein
MKHTVEVSGILDSLQREDSMLALLVATYIDGSHFEYLEEIGSEKMWHHFDKAKDDHISGIQAYESQTEGHVILHHFMSICKKRGWKMRVVIPAFHFERYTMPERIVEL